MNEQVIGVEQRVKVDSNGSWSWDNEIEDALG